MGVSSCYQAGYGFALETCLEHTPKAYDAMKYSQIIIIFQISPLYGIFFPRKTLLFLK
ncbi:hypothetical protein ISS30_07770 [bacterium]|nr:hypothetical protein [FCB group bacterium]MBL7191580.1 hypothetical protein [bacterium]